MIFFYPPIFSPPWNEKTWHPIKSHHDHWIDGNFLFLPVEGGDCSSNHLWKICASQNGLKSSQKKSGWQKYDNICIYMLYIIYTYTSNYTMYMCLSCHHRTGPLMILADPMDFGFWRITLDLNLSTTVYRPQRWICVNDVRGFHPTPEIVGVAFWFWIFFGYKANKFWFWICLVQITFCNHSHPFGPVVFVLLPQLYFFNWKI